MVEGCEKATPKSLSKKAHYRIARQSIYGLVYYFNNN